MSAQQIISIDEQGNRFVLNEENLSAVLQKVDPGMKVSVVAVAGAFRTGKSFLLDLFLRYLRSDQAAAEKSEELSDDWILSEGKYLEGNVNPVKGVDPGQVVRTASDKGFSWRGGNERNTTGIWLWSEPFLRKLPSGETISVLLMDTQGMFDSKLSQMLTACIFGLSTLISSHQIYNVERRIQEDHLQHLALFTEYGRVAHSKSHPSGAEAAPETEGRSAVFQRVEFLVRDSPELEGLDEDELKEQLPAMDTYLQSVLETESRAHKDLRDIREHLHDCFEHIGAFLLPHPGLEVTNKHYDGDVEKIRPQFWTLLTCYVKRTFGEALIPKKVNGRFIDAPELLHLVKSYVDTFHEANSFPEAKTLLAATAEANNLNAKEAAFRNYREQMDAETGAQYLSAQALATAHDIARAAAVQKYEMIATIGPAHDIAKYKTELRDQMAAQYNEYVEANKNRDPFKNLEFYALPLAIGISTYFLRVILDIFCWQPVTTEFDWEIRDFCKSFSDTLCDVYHLILLIGVVVVIYKTNGAWNRVKDIFGFVRHTVANGDIDAASTALAASRAALQQTISVEQREVKFAKKTQ